MKDQMNSLAQFNSFEKEQTMGDKQLAAGKQRHSDGWYWRDRHAAIIVELSKVNQGREDWRGKERL